jgi:CDP-4-dehydro-6-deoxyglucose reductase
MVMIYTNSGSSFEQIGQDSILTSAEKAGVNFPYSCRDGRCSSCKCKLLSGQTECRSDELGLTEYQKSQGWILSCVRSAKTAVELEVDDLGGLPLIKPTTLPCKIDSISQISSKVTRVFLRLPPGNKVRYYSGQYIDIIIGGIRRSYSIANAESADDRLELHIAKIEHGLMSKYWFEEAKKNDLIRINGPLGTFFFRNLVGKDLVFLATGTGIAPIKAMIESIKLLAPEDHPKSLTVFWGGRTSDDLYFDPSAEHERLRYVPVLSRSAADWEGQQGYVQDVFLNEHPELSNCVVYACGSEKMIHSSYEILVKSGLSEKKFFSDVFLSSAPL